MSDTLRGLKSVNNGVVTLRVRLGGCESDRKRLPLTTQHARSLIKLSFQNYRSSNRLAGEDMSNMGSALCASDRVETASG